MEKEKKKRGRPFIENKTPKPKSENPPGTPKGSTRIRFANFLPKDENKFDTINDFLMYLNPRETSTVNYGLYGGTYFTVEDYRALLEAYILWMIMDENSYGYTAFLRSFINVVDKNVRIKLASSFQYIQKKFKDDPTSQELLEIANEIEKHKLEECGLNGKFKENFAFKLLNVKHGYIEKKQADITVTELTQKFMFTDNTGEAINFEDEMQEDV